MNWYNDLTIRWKISIPISILLAAYVVSFGLNYHSQNRINEDAKVISEQLVRQLTLILEADRDLHQAWIAEQSMVHEAVTPNLQAERQDNMDQALERAEKAITMEGGDTSIIINALAKWRRVSNDVIAVKSADDTIQAIALNRTDSKQAFDAARDILDTKSEQYRQDVQKVTKTLEADIAAGRSIDFTLAGIMIITLALSLLFLPGTIAKPIIIIRQRLNAIANGDGDLRPRLNLTRKDELGQLANHFDQFMAKLQSIVTNIKYCTEQLDTSAKSMSTETSNAQQLTNRQSKTLQEAVSSIEEITHAIHEVATNTSNTAEQTSEADRISATSSTELEKATEILNRLERELTSAAGMINALENQANNATTVLDVIRAIAEQTNLLALNAAIEAARAGEQGRGFAVVADEVRTLASRTQDSTREIQVTLENLQSEVKRAVQAITQNAATAKEAVEASATAGQGFQLISHSISNITQMSLQIAAAAEEQSQVIQGINSNFNQIQSQAADSNESSKRSVAAGSNMLQLVRQLTDNVNNFKI